MRHGREADADGPGWRAAVAVLVMGRCGWAVRSPGLSEAGAAAGAGPPTASPELPQDGSTDAWRWSISPCGPDAPCPAAPGRGPSAVPELFAELDVDPAILDLLLQGVRAADPPPPPLPHLVAFLDADEATGIPSLSVSACESSAPAAACATSRATKERLFDRLASLSLNETLLCEGALSMARAAQRAAGARAPSAVMSSLAELGGAAEAGPRRRGSGGSRGGGGAPPAGQACALCFSDASATVQMQCGHRYCLDCITHSMSSLCPTCRTPLVVRRTAPVADASVQRHRQRSAPEPPRVEEPRAGQRGRRRPPPRQAAGWRVMPTLVAEEPPRQAAQVANPGGQRMQRGDGAAGAVVAQGNAGREAAKQGMQKLARALRKHRTLIYAVIRTGGMIVTGMHLFTAAGNSGSRFWKTAAASYAVSSALLTIAVTISNLHHQRTLLMRERAQLMQQGGTQAQQLAGNLQQQRQRPPQPPQQRPPQRRYQ